MREPAGVGGVASLYLILSSSLQTGSVTMATTKAREDIKNDLKTLKEDIKVGAREEGERLRARAEAAEARLRT